MPNERLADLQGPVLRATQIELLSKDSAEATKKDLARWFVLDNWVRCDVLDWESRIWSNFRLHPDGPGRLLVRDQSQVGDSELSRLIQRVQELGNYRNMTLMHSLSRNVSRRRSVSWSARSPASGWLW